MVQILSATLFLLLLARLLRMPGWSWRAILGGMVLVLAGTQLLPPGTPLREDVRASLWTLFWVALAALPVLGYVLLIRGIRRRTNPATGADPADRPTGLVLIPEDAALVHDTEGALAREAGQRDERVSLAWRDEARGLAGHVRARVHGTAGELELLWVAPGARGAGIGSRLLRQAEAEAHRRGASTMLAGVWNDEAARFLVARGYRPYAALGTRRHLSRALP